MQWNARPQRRLLHGRPAGGSTCRSIMDPVYGYQAINVEAQKRSSSSLLHWTRRMIEIRKQHPVFGIGDLPGARLQQPVACSPSCASTATTACCASTTCRRFPQPVELDLRRFEGSMPVELTGRRALPADRRAALPADPAGPRLLCGSACQPGETAHEPSSTDLLSRLDPDISAGSRGKGTAVIADRASSTRTRWPPASDVRHDRCSERHRRGRRQPSATSSCSAPSGEVEPRLKHAVDRRGRRPVLYDAVHDPRPSTAACCAASPTAATLEPAHVHRHRRRARHLPAAAW